MMEALEGGDQITQRELARVTGLNLKKVNYCLRKLLEKGHVKFQRARKNPDKRAYLYILTPAGLKAKSQLTYGFLKFTLDSYNRMEDKLRWCLMEMARAGVERVVLYGASDVARILLGLADRDGPQVVGVIDGGCEARIFHGVPVFRLHQLREISWDRVLITTLEDMANTEERLREAGVALEAIWALS